MSTIPFFTTIPISMMAPIIDITFKLVPVSSSISTIPEKANMIEVMMMPG